MGEFGAVMVANGRLWGYRGGAGRMVVVLGNSGVIVVVVGG